MRIQLATLLVLVVLACPGGATALAPDPPVDSEAAPASAKEESEEQGPGAGVCLASAVADLRRLAVRRQAGRGAVSWHEIELALDSLEHALSTPAEGPEALGENDPWGGLPVAHVLQEVAVGAQPRERVQLMARFPGIVDAAPDEARERAVLRAFVRVIEPLVAPADVPLEKRGRFVGHATEMFERLEVQLTDPLSRVRPAFLVNARERIERLRTGAPTPRFIARDAAGNELRSAQLQGKITVLRFWDPGSAASIAAHLADANLVRDHWDAPFELVGVAVNEDRTSYLELLADRSFAGMQLFDGPISAQLADALAKDAGRYVTAGGENAPIGASPAWSAPTPGSVFVVDARGIVRGRDLPYDDLRALVRSLLDEENHRRRESLLTQGRSR